MCELTDKWPRCHSHKTDKQEQKFKSDSKEAGRSELRSLLFSHLTQLTQIWLLGSQDPVNRDMAPRVTRAGSKERHGGGEAGSAGADVPGRVHPLRASVREGSLPASGTQLPSSSHLPDGRGMGHLRRPEAGCAPPLGSLGAQQHMHQPFHSSGLE